ncbi:hypothetical protein ACH47B_20000 [Rhodococcus sp. NPDC019627]|uniref:hypothetical protein n=1 Tax=unclassified Rhodococcus (in: high G+C Gram-positive bacteria) TaxID=192944 RepID=UPI0033C202AA
MVAAVVDRVPQQPWRRKAILAAWTVLAGVSMAILGYILADVSSIAFEKLPGQTH